VPIDRANAFSQFTGIEAAAFDVDDTYPIRLQAGRPAASDADRSMKSSLLMSGQAADQSRSSTQDVWPPRLGDYPLRHPYSPVADLDAAEFRTKHPTWDGRGVTI